MYATRSYVTDKNDNETPLRLFGFYRGTRKEKAEGKNKEKRQKKKTK